MPRLTVGKLVSMVLASIIAHFGLRHLWYIGRISQLQLFIYGLLIAVVIGILHAWFWPQPKE